MSLDSFLISLESLSDVLPTLLADELGEHTEDILEVQKEQLFQGLTSEGKPISPSYSEDSFFHSKSAAEKYAQWKASIQPRPQRAVDTPNLFINGHLFHDNLIVEINGETILVDAGTNASKNVLDKYGIDTLGLTEDNWGLLIKGSDGDGEIIQGLRARVLNYLTNN